jgi:hypothetical protein
LRDVGFFAGNCEFRVTKAWPIRVDGHKQPL